MPQMMPLNWVFMFLQLSLIIFIMMTIIFNNFNPQLKSKMLTLFKPSIKWLW